MSPQVMTWVVPLCFGAAATLVMYTVSTSRSHSAIFAQMTKLLDAMPISRSSRIDALGAATSTEETVARLLRTQVVGALGAGVISALLVASSPSATTVLAAVFIVAGAWQFPLIRARRVEDQRRASIDRQLTDALGEIVMGVEAGLSLESVVTYFGERHETVLAHEFAQLSHILRSGEPRREALRQFADRNPTSIVQSFTAAIEQNHVLGTPLATVLRKQAETTRRHRRQAAETRAAAVSMKMIFPTVFCILPVLMVVVVGPAIVRLSEVL